MYAIISDMHINEQAALCRTRLEDLTAFLTEIRGARDEHLLVAGDGIERLTFNDSHKINRMPVVQLLYDIQADGRLMMLQGNHDADTDGLCLSYSGREFETEQLYVWHGHKLDFFCRNGGWDVIGMSLVWLWEKISRRSAASAAKARSSFSPITLNLRRMIRFDEKMCRLARKKQKLCVCGHTHGAIIRAGDDWTYVNAGSWVDDHASFVYVEQNGKATLHNYRKPGDFRCRQQAR